MLFQYSKFFINGGILGIASWGLQALLYDLLKVHSGINYGLATSLTYIPLIAINFLIQKKLIFLKEGFFWRFIVANLLIMALVSFLSLMFRSLIASYLGVQWGDIGGFASAALIGSVPSYLIQKFWVFNKTQGK